MIEKMKKLSLLIYHNSKDKFLTSLQNFGVVHLESDKSYQDENINLYKEKIVRLQKVEKFLINFQNEQKSKFQNSKIDLSDEKFDKIVETIESIKEKIDSSNSQIDNIKKEIIQLTPWGIFDESDIKRLEEIGLTLRFFFTSIKSLAGIKSESRRLHEYFFLIFMYLFIYFSNRKI